MTQSYILQILQLQPVIGSTCPGWSAVATCILGIPDKPTKELHGTVRSWTHGSVASDFSPNLAKKNNMTYLLSKTMDLKPKTIVYTSEGSGKLWLILDQKCRYDSRSGVFHENTFTPQLSARDSIGGSVNPMTRPFWGYFAYPHVQRNHTPSGNRTWPWKISPWRLLRTSPLVDFPATMIFNRRVIPSQAKPYPELRPQARQSLKRPTMVSFKSPSRLSRPSVPSMAWE